MFEMVFSPNPVTAPDVSILGLCEASVWSHQRREFPPACLIFLTLSVNALMLTLTSPTSLPNEFDESQAMFIPERNSFFPLITVQFPFIESFTVWGGVAAIEVKARHITAKIVFLIMVPIITPLLNGCLV
jgi:hypothetical protein